MQTKLDKLIESIQFLEMELSNVRDNIEDTQELSELHRAVSNFLTITGNRD